MAKSKKKRAVKSQDKSSLKMQMVITWQHVFNANDKTLEDISSVCKRADASGYSYFAYIGRLWRVTPEKSWEDLGIETEHLVNGVEVTLDDMQVTVSAVPKPKSYYVVIERNYEYNDETYNVTGGGNPVAVYNSRAEADTIAKEMSIDQAVDLVDADSVWEYLDNDHYQTYEGLVTMDWFAWHDWLMDNGFGEDELPKIKLDGVPSSRTLREWFNPTNDWSEDKRRKALQHFDLPFFEVYEVRS